MGQTVRKWVILLISPVMLLAGLGFSYMTYSFTQTAVKTTAEIVSVQSRQGDPVLYRPIVRFLDLSETEVSVPASPYASENTFVIGSKVNIIYTIDEPTEVWIDDWLKLWGANVLMLALGGVPLLVWAYSRLRRRK